MLRTADVNLEQLSKQHKQQMDRMNVNHVSEMKNIQKKTRQEQVLEEQNLLDNIRKDFRRDFMIKNQFLLGSSGLCLLFS